MKMKLTTKCKVPCTNCTMTTSKHRLTAFCIFEQLHSLFNLAHQFRVAVLRDRPLDYILKVTELPVGIIATSYLSSCM